MFQWILRDWRSIGFVVFSTVLIYASTIIGRFSVLTRDETPIDARLLADLDLA